MEGDSPFATSISPELLVCGLSEEPNILQGRMEMGRIDIHSLTTVSVRHTGRAHGALITLHRTPCHITPHCTTSHYTTTHHTHTGLVRKTGTCVCVRTHLPSIVSGCFRKSEGLTVNLLPATFRVTFSPEGDVDSLEVGVASPLTLPSLELPLSGSESAS